MTNNAMPRKPTNEMLEAGHRVGRDMESYAYIKAVWEAMFDAAPVLATAPAEPPKDGEFEALLARLNNLSEHAEIATPEELRLALNDSIAALVGLPVREWWRHLKTGGAYELIVPTAWLEWDHRACTVYRGEDGRTWVRPCSEFYDGRFERTPRPHSPNNGSVDERMKSPACRNHAGPDTRKVESSNLSAAAPPEVAALIERLRAVHAPLMSVAPFGFNMVATMQLCGEAAEALARLSAPVPDKEK